MRNLVTDVPGVLVGNAQDAQIATGVTAMLFDAPAVASVAVSGGAPGLRDAALLEPDMTVERVDALVLSGGSVFGLDAPGGVISALRERGGGSRSRASSSPSSPAPSCSTSSTAATRIFGASRSIGASAPRPPARPRAISRWGRMARALARLSPTSRAASARPPPSPKTGSSSARWWRSTRWGRRPWATPRISGRRPTSATANSAAGLAGTVRRDHVRDPHERRGAAQHQYRHRRHRRRTHQGPGQAHGHHGPGRPRPRAAPGPRSHGRRCRVRRFDRPVAQRPSARWS